MQDAEIREVYSADDLVDAQTMRGLLVDAGIEVRVVGSTLQTIIGDLPAQLATPRLWVHASDYDRARELIEAARNQRSNKISQGNADWVCPRCAEQNPAGFDLCWQCQQHAPSEHPPVAE